jgi:hypothetical protein
MQAVVVSKAAVIRLKRIEILRHGEMKKKAPAT